MKEQDLLGEIGFGKQSFLYAFMFSVKNTSNRIYWLNLINFNKLQFVL